jgi:excisionase family DNA binding protein
VANRNAPSRRTTLKIRNLREHPEPYVTTTDLAEYWSVSRKQIYKQIEAGTLKAIRLGPRLLRIRTADALAFERLARMTPDHGDALQKRDAAHGSEAHLPSTRSHHRSRR